MSGGLHILKPLVVTGDLIVDGFLRDNGPDALLLVGGTFACTSLCTNGAIGVGKSLLANDFVCAMRSDRALVAKTIESPIVVEEAHDVRGRVKAKHHVKGGAAASPRLRALFRDALFGADGTFDPARLAATMVDGQPMLR